MKKTARFIKDLAGWISDARLYKLSHPIFFTRIEEIDGKYFERRKQASWVIVSAASVLGEPETYIFPATRDGEARWMGELSGSFKGDLDHEKALEYAGYEIEPSA